MTIPAPLPPPTTAAVDEALAQAVAVYMQEAAQSQLMQPGVTSFTLRAVAVCYTQHDGTMGFPGLNVLDPTVNGADTVTCRGLVDEYGAIVIRIYEWPVMLPTVAQVTAPDAVQAAANDPTQWVAPE